MNNKHTHYNRKILAGCGFLALGIFFGLVLLAGLLLRNDRAAARYPDSIPLSSHENYSGLPFSYKWDNTYRSGDPFPDVYNWYSSGFDLGPEMRANGRCILMEDTRKQFFATRTMSVLLCNTPNGNLIYVSRSTSIR